MAKFNKFMGIVCAVCLLVCVAMLVAGCNEEPEPTTTVKPQVTNTSYTISVRTAGGMLMDDITVYVYEDTSKSDLVDLPKKLDSEGKYSFVAPTSDQYIVVLQGVPEGYDVQEQYLLSGAQMEIVLTSAPIAGEAPANTTYQLGDIIYDYTFTAIDGQKYTISEILKEKEAVVLNFWYVGCHFCMEEFPALQDAYEIHGANVEVLALDVENDTNDEIQAVIDQYGLTFPVAKVSSSMLTAMKGNGCPTTVVVDRYGMISYMYTGPLDDPALFPALMRHFSEADYVQATLKNVEDIVEEEDKPYGCEWYPYGVGALSEYTAEVRADELVYYTLYRISSATLRIEDPDVYLVYEGNTYYPENGVLEMNFTDDVDTFTGVTVALGTTGGVDKEVVLYQIPVEGSSENPFVLELGEFTIDVNSKASYYSFTSEHAGTFTIIIDQLPEGVSCHVNMTNLRTSKVTDLGSDSALDSETGKYVFAIEVEAGDTVRLIISTGSENAENTAIQALASIPEVEGTGGSEEESYNVTVTSEAGVPMGGVSMTVTVAGQTYTYVTDENGVARLELPAGTYSVTLQVPDGYYATEKYLLTPAKKDLSIVLVKSRSYTLRVSITGAALTETVTVKIYANDTLEELIYEGQLDANGEARFTYGYIDGCVAVLEGLPSNVYVHSSYPLTGTLTEIALVRTSIGDTNAANQKYQVGDMLADFSVTTPDGQIFTLSELLQEKKAVLLAFWHCSNSASVQGLNALQSIYEQYADTLQILAMNPLDSSDADISAFQGLYDLGFPMAQCSSQWESAFQLTGYPTLVMIDRDGTICFIHTGAIVETENLTKILDIYTAEDYATTVVNSVDELLGNAEQAGTEANPYVVSQGTEELIVTLEAGQVAWFTFQEQEAMSVQAQGAGVYMIYGGNVYENTDGTAEVIINLVDAQQALVIGNRSSEAVEIRIVLTVLAAG